MRPWCRRSRVLCGPPPTGMTLRPVLCRPPPNPSISERPCPPAEIPSPPPTSLPPPPSPKSLNHRVGLTTRGPKRAKNRPGSKLWERPIQRLGPRNYGVKGAAETSHCWSAYETLSFGEIQTSTFWGPKLAQLASDPGGGGRCLSVQG